ncbi:hypothetical protein Salat_2064400 [Sesamum alatum]|uniref:Uncharacterized protein n=1 Tax=Sesamum alatum TaxID=300844 RepID=A0AAE1Y0W4_9LAMI|nr:hypothetical protein Salat_2064400 [Sesamum alatum]
MESANWDIEAAANAIQPDIRFINRDHRAFAFESFVCREIFAGFNDPNFSVQTNEQSLPKENHQRRIFFFEQFKKLRSVNLIHFLKQNPNSLFGKFLKSKYLHFVHPKMEFSFSGNLNQRKMVNSGNAPETDKIPDISEVYMQSVTEDIFAAAATEIFGWRSRFGSGFKLNQTVVQSQLWELDLSKKPILVNPCFFIQNLNENGVDRILQKGVNLKWQFLDGGGKGGTAAAAAREL